MKRIVVTLHDQAVEVRYVDRLALDIDVLFRDCIASLPSAPRHIEISEDESGCFSISDNGEQSFHDLTRGELLAFLMDAVVRSLVTDMSSAVALHAGSIAHNHRSVLVAGGTGSGKSSLVAWLVDSGFAYLSDEVTVLTDGSSAILGLPRALVLKPGAVEQVQEFRTFEGTPSVPAGSHVMQRPSEARLGAIRPYPCGLIIFPRFAPKAGLSMEVLTPAQAGLRLFECNLNARNCADGGFAAITRLARLAPAVIVEYGDFADLTGRADALVQFALEADFDGPSIRRFLSAFARPLVPQETTSAKRYETPPPTPRREVRKKLTVGMATYDDYDGVYFSIQALRLYHPEVLDDIEFLVIDNHPDGPCADPLKALENSILNYRYVPLGEWGGTAVRQTVFEEAIGDNVLCIDSHVFIVKGAVKRLLYYFEANGATRDLLQGPLLYDDLQKLATHFRPEWRGGMYGRWEMDERGSDPDAPAFDIPMQGMGLFVCRRVAWPGFNPRFRGFGGEEGYIHEKFRRRGGRTLCLPFLRWMHRFDRPMGLSYTNTWEDRVRNYMIGFRELGMPTSEFQEHFRELLGADVADRIFDQIKHELGAC